MLRRLCWILTLLSFGAVSAQACSIFVLTDGKRVLFCNNEDFSNANTRLWFIPDGKGGGSAYVGFDDGWAQGGVDTDGLAYDWVAGFKEKWEPERLMVSPLVSPRGNSSQRMLETCATLEEAIAFYQEFYEPSFAYGKLLVADRTGASAVLGVRNGRFHVDRSIRCQALGSRNGQASKLVAPQPPASLEMAAQILQAVRQEGPNATKYSNVFDLQSGEIFVYRFPEQVEPVRLDLRSELKKGGHYYDIPRLRGQLSEKLRPLTLDMKKY